MTSSSGRALGSPKLSHAIVTPLIFASCAGRSATGGGSGTLAVVAAAGAVAQPAKRSRAHERAHHAGARRLIDEHRPADEQHQHHEAHEVALGEAVRQVLIDVEPHQHRVQREERHQPIALGAQPPGQRRQRQHVPVVGVDHQPHVDEQRPDGERLDGLGVAQPERDERGQHELQQEERDAPGLRVDLGARRLDLGRRHPVARESRPASTTRPAGTRCGTNTGWRRSARAAPRAMRCS